MPESATDEKISQNLTVYLPKELAYQLADAKKQGFEASKFVQEALAAHFSGESADRVSPALDELRRLSDFLEGPAASLWTGMSGTPVDVAIQVMHAYGVMRDQAENPAMAITLRQPVTMKVAFANNTHELQALLDNVIDQGGYPQSVATMKDDTFVVLVEWPVE